MAQILIIDDHDSMREGLELLLRRKGNRTLAAESGARGLQLLEEQGADVVITDLKMAHMDGIEVLRAIREKHPEVEVLVMTAYGTIEKAVEAMKLGAADFLTKPFSSEEFAALFADVTRSHAERAFAMLDANEDGEISAEEFRFPAQMMVRMRWMRINEYQGAGE